MSFDTKPCIHGYEERYLKLSKKLKLTLRLCPPRRVKATTAP
jgi:hypothetical protein